MLHEILCTGELHAIGGEGSVFFADFRDVRETLVSRFGGSVRMVYLDPPFNTGGSYEFRRGKKQVAYRDKFDREEYFALIEDAARLSGELLTDDGTLFLHVDHRVAAYCRVLLDEIFGMEAFTNEIIWTYRSGGRAVNSFSNKHEVILMYRKTPGAYFDITAVGVPRGREKRNHMKRNVDADGRVFFSIKTQGKEYRYYEDDAVYPSDVWDDLEHLNQRDPERTGFITQKPAALLKRMVLSCTEPGDTVADLFSGSGTTAFAAASLNRRFLTVDKAPVALAVTRKRLLKRGFGLSLYEKNRPLTVEFSPSENKRPVPVEKYFDIEPSGDRLSLTVKELSDRDLPYYIAVGRVDGGVFLAQSYLDEPRPKSSLSLAAGQALHVVDEDFGQAFYEFEREQDE